MTEQIAPIPPSSRCLDRFHRLCMRLGDVVGYVSAALMVLMTLSILVTIILRRSHVDNAWAYNLDLYALIWVSFVGASFTALRGEHVTSGIALENIYPRSARLMMTLRFVLIGTFLVIFTVSGLIQFANGVQTHEVTLDSAAWPVWIAYLGLPVGTSLWLIFEIHHFLRRLMAK